MEGRKQDGVQPGRSDDATGKRFIRVDAVYSRKDRQVHFIKTAQVPRTPQKLRKYALIIKREIGSLGMVVGTRVEINSQCLSRALKDVFPVESLGIDKENLEVSCETLWHARPALRERLDLERKKQDQSRDNVIISDIETMLDFLQEEYAALSSDLTILQEKRMISHSLLWCLFPPRVEVYTDANVLHEPQILRCRSYRFEEDELTGKKWFSIVGQCLNHDGKNFGWSEQILKIPFFDATVQISSLIAYPLVYHPEQMSLRKRLDARGHTFVGLLAQPVCREYNTMAITSHRMGRDWEQDAFHVSGRVMVDPDRFSKSCSLLDTLREPLCLRSKAFAPTKTPTEDLMFCYYRILGFSLNQKRWAALAVSQLRDPEWYINAFNKVIMPDRQKCLLHSLVSAHQTENGGHDGFDDIIKGKGRGLIGLLSGGPGLGKTLTAEAVAEVSRRPLYAVNAGDLGTEVSVVERRLGEVLDNASSWNCVLLIDECDVFLRQRDHVSLVNNALVSIFLRRLEYFQGLAILTTNRFEDIDKALLSRLHFKFNYEDLGSMQRLNLWKSFLEIMDIRNLDMEELTKLSTDYELNGREIKNAVFCAKLIAQNRECNLTIRMITDVLNDLSGK